MAKSPSHKRAQSKAAGETGKTEVPLPRKRRLDAQSGNTSTEVERSGQPARLRKAAARLKSAGTKRKVLQVPQNDMEKAEEAMKQEGVSGTVKNMGGTKSKSV